MTPLINLKVESQQLDRKINQFAVATGRTREDVTQQALKSMVGFALQFTPPASQGSTGKDAQRQGQKKITKDLDVMGFRPVDIKHKENPAFADPDAYHRDYLAGSVPKTLFFVERSKFKTMQVRLFAAIGKLSSGWAAAAFKLNLPVPAWILRHAGLGRGSVSVQAGENSYGMTATNHVPNTAGAVASEMERRKPYWISYARGNLDRQLKAKLAGAWGR